MPAKTASKKVECLNPNTGGKMNIDAHIYELFSKAIYHTLKKGKALTFTQMVEGVHECFKQQKVKFSGSVSWYAVTIKNDMEARGLIETCQGDKKKLNRLIK